MDRRLHETLERALGATITRAVPVRGGDVAIAYAVDLDDGRRVFAKTHPGAPPEFFTTEATGLSWLGAAGAIAVPEVLEVSDDRPNHLVITWIHEGPGRRQTEADLGAAPGATARRRRAVLRAGGPPDDRESRAPNEPCATWAEFYATNRLLPLAALARTERALPDDVISALEDLADGLERYDDGEPPARLHGDLWAGNRLIDTAGGSWLIDPAAHGGHREFDLAMMRLFGGFGPECFAAYADVHPLRDGWEERVDLHQIAPLVVHAIKFGGHYVGAPARAIGRFA